MVTQRQRKTPTPNGHASTTSDASEHTDLMTHLDDLKHELERSQQNEKQLQQTIEQLQTQIEQHTSIVRTLETHLEQSNQVHTELKKAQNTALKLAEENKDLIAEKLQHAEEVAKLRSQLKQAEQSDKIAHFQSQLDHVQQDALKLAEANQKLIEEKKQIHTELSEAQQTALHLAESNQKLVEENQTLKEQQPVAKLVPKSAPKAPPSDADLRSHQDIIKKRQAAALAHPVFPNSPTNANQDASWFD